MKKIALAFLAVIAMASFAPLAFAKKPAVTTIQSGLILYSPGHYFAGDPLTVGFDAFGYNYQGHMFSSYYANCYLGGAGFPPYEGDDVAYAQRLADEGYGTDPYGTWYWPYRNDYVLMKWNDAWLSNKDQDGDGKLDRHYGFASYIGSGAWETNHQFGEYEDDGKIFKWNYFVKIVAVPADASKLLGVWYTADDVEIGPDIWGEFAIIQEVYNDQGTGDHGLYYLSPNSAGLGAYKP